jgi:hypothetical protein
MVQAIVACDFFVVVTAPFASFMFCRAAASFALKPFSGGRGHLEIFIFVGDRSTRQGH